MPHSRFLGIALLTLLSTTLCASAPSSTPAVLPDPVPPPLPGPIPDFSNQTVLQGFIAEATDLTLVINSPVIPPLFRRLIPLILPTPEIRPKHRSFWVEIFRIHTLYLAGSIITTSIGILISSESPFSINKLPFLSSVWFRISWTKTVAFITSLAISHASYPHTWDSRFQTNANLF